MHHWLMPIDPTFDVERHFHCWSTHLFACLRWWKETYFPVNLICLLLLLNSKFYKKLKDTCGRRVLLLYFVGQTFVKITPFWSNVLLVNWFPILHRNQLWDKHQWMRSKSMHPWCMHWSDWPLWMHLRSSVHWQKLFSCTWPVPYQALPQWSDLSSFPAPLRIHLSLPNWIYWYQIIVMHDTLID